MPEHEELKGNLCLCSRLQLQASSCLLPICRSTGKCSNYAVYAATYQLYPSTWSFDYVADPADMAEQMVQMLEKPFDPSAQLEHVKKYSWPQLIGKWKEVIEKV